MRCRQSSETLEWLERLPDAVRDVERRWSLTAEAPFEEEATASWVAPARLANGGSAVLKLGMPHMEAEHELHGLRYWDGNPTVRLLEADAGLNALLVEHCKPGTSLRALDEPVQDVVIASLLRRLWRTPSTPHPFRPDSTIRRFADLLGVDHERVRLWTFARAAAAAWDREDEGWTAFAREMAP